MTRKKRGRRGWGSGEQLAALYQTYIGAVQRECLGLLADPVAASDAAHETFRRVVERAEAGGFRRTPRRFLFGEARRVCDEQLRERAREMVALRILLTPADDPVELAVDAEELRDYVDRLSEPQKAVLAQIFAGYGIKEIAYRSGGPIGTVASRLGRIRDVARRRQDEVGAVLLAGALRLRHPHRGGLAVPFQQSSALIASVAALLVAPTMTSAVPATAAGGPQQLAATASSSVSAIQIGSPAPPSRRVDRGALAAGGTTSQRRTASPASPSARPSGGLVMPWAESPNDSTVVSVAASPHYDRDHTVIALGVGHGCACPLLFRSTDGGVHWTSTLQAAVGSQVLLSPSYPADPRIFIGQTAAVVPNSPDYVAAAWGSPFRPLAVPPGQLGMAGGRLLTAAAGAVWSMEAAVVTPVMSYQGQAPAVLASTGETTYILAPSHTVAVGTVTSGPALFACTPNCQLVGAVPLPDVGLLAASGRTVVAASQGRIVVSEDGGQHFADVTPAGVQQIVSLSANGGTVWALVKTPQEQLVRFGMQGWTHMRLPAGNPPIAITLVSPRRALAAFLSGATACTGDGGDSWAAVCPPDTT